MITASVKVAAVLVIRVVIFPSRRKCARVRHKLY
jgi:hypothetical protein